MPATQVCPTHTVPQTPQLLESTWVSVHTPPQSVKPVSQMQSPAVHTSVAVQVVAHTPQLSGSCCRLTQTPLQSEKPLAWSQAHIDPAHV